MQTYFEGEQASLFAPDTFAGRMSQAASAQARRTGRISGLSWRKLLDYIAPDYQFLDLSSDAGNLLGQYEWTTRSALHGGCWLRNTGPSPRDAIESFLSQILQAHPPKKYYLTTAACLGILRRAEERGKPLPKALDIALRIQAGLIGSTNGRGKKNPSSEPVAFAQNQRDEVRDLHNIASALGAQPGMKQQTFIASFSAGAGATAGTIGYAEEVAPTLKGSPSGNCMPSVMCLHDQGGQRMDVSENMTGTLRANERGISPWYMRIMVLMPVSGSPAKSVQRSQHAMVQAAEIPHWCRSQTKSTVSSAISSTVSRKTAATAVDIRKILHIRLQL